MSGYRPRPYLEAAMGPRACVVVRRLLGEDTLQRVARYAAAAEVSPDPEMRAAAVELWRWLETMRESERQFRVRQTDGGFADETAKPLEEAPDAKSASETSPMGSPRLVVKQVADRLDCSQQYVRRLLRDGPLVGHRQGGVWFIDEGSVSEFEARRRPVA